LIYPYLGVNAEILIGIGEEVIVTRPNIFGPQPKDIADIVFKSIKYRKMAHTAEDLTCKALEEHFGFQHCQTHSDVKHGFVLEFNENPEIDLEQLEKIVKEYIDNEVDISYLDDCHIRVGDDEKFHCTGPRIHVRNAGEIENFRLLKEPRFDHIAKKYAIEIKEKTGLNVKVIKKIQGSPMEYDEESEKIAEKMWIARMAMQGIDDDY
jgi:hypothetical protein